MKVKNILLFGAMSVVSIIGTNVESSATSNLEKELMSLMGDEDSSNVVIDNGIVLKKGESLELGGDVKLSNDTVLEVKEGGVLYPKEEGTVFVSKEIDGKIHIVEVYVSESEEVSMLSMARASTTVNRGYYKVFIDPGHGGADNGAVSNGVKEDELNLQIAKRVETKLKAKGIEVKMSRTTDVFYSLSERAKMANNYGADVFVSIHQNSATATSAVGIETFHHTNKVAHKPLSDEIQKEAISNTGATNRGVKSANLGVLRESTMPSALFEGGFISNATERSKLVTPDYQEKLAKAIADGIESYLKKNIQLSGGSSSNNTSGNSNSTLPVLKTGTVNTDNLNVRNGAGTSYTKLGSLNKGAKVEVVGESNGWLKIKYGNGYGYISGLYVTYTTVGNNITNNGTTNNDTTAISKGVVNTASLNVRNGYGTSSTKIGSLSEGAKVDIVESKDGWYKIKYGQGYGYVSGAYIKIESSNTTPTPTPTPTPPSNTNNGTATTTEKGKIVKTDTLNVRSGTSTSTTKLGVLKAGETVELVSKTGDWYKIKYGSGYGYIHGYYVEKVTTTTTTPSTPNTTPSTPSTTPNTSTTTKGVVNTDSLNVRNGAGTSYAKLGSLSKGTSVEIISESNGWYKIKYGNGYGYVSGLYVNKVTNSTQSTPSTPNTTPSTPSTTPNTSTVTKGVVNTASLNVRSGASTSTTKLGSLSKGASVEIISESNGWLKIKYGNGYGYISSLYVNKVTTTQTTTPSTPNTSTTKQGIVNTPVLNVRSGTSTSTTKLGSLTQGAKVEIVESTNGWYKIKYGNGYGYISSAYVKL